MRVAPDEEGSMVAARFAIAPDRLGGGEDVRLVEGGTERRTAMTGRAECNALRRVRGVRTDVVVRGNERVDIDQGRGVGRRSGCCVDEGHRLDLGGASIAVIRSTASRSAGATRSDSRRRA